ncbi:hypothetical protein NE237_010876 [Protea cynaroides]|uniref:Uncharacterized protein n=1 Tax=Protea cynaroides TaxID=273540 RepID=A0A9Q0L0L2_9MAGN|nr:hypothetical protein NE237_010876 [Protea cynaroides]
MVVWTCLKNGLNLVARVRNSKMGLTEGEDLALALMSFQSLSNAHTSCMVLILDMACITLIVIIDGSFDKETSKVCWSMLLVTFAAIWRLIMQIDTRGRILRSTTIDIAWKKKMQGVLIVAPEPLDTGKACKCASIFLLGGNSSRNRKSFGLAP